MKKLDPVKLELALADMMFAKQTAQDAMVRLAQAVASTNEAFEMLSVEARIAFAGDPYLENSHVDRQALGDFAALDQAAEALALIVNSHISK
ncbi:hypothetical protein [Mesorhizobium sp. M7A.F.Ce.TU.012.03.2.1]|uniref:hypothetical protein n=1 Tax=Mesorhizobium sp. M7A.F.Ce.TU.012.03.2.1 TaxID=2493681 RepID=UPI000FD706C6|nr:hypothetical protein [Mesorhizobium sp. M7A.F.Ce.TU.012.03.2.1]AZV21497.1 hypothetical protein EJ079_21885 [Mesorhizobium sp. M7A.F.Ce.TU.012.03.2.1]